MAKLAVAELKNEEEGYIMNERILELAEQAALLGPSSRVGNAHEATEKFAELIIRECAELFPERHYHYSGLAVKRNIKKHFGVEE